mmetsp:Transcript_14054/g.27893  ORF Transcript_14054/g.27893 Transcript_14054/m.27893 type:complete len:152 (-) Transcript_14054:71-526(-)
MLLTMAGPICTFYAVTHFICTYHRITYQIGYEVKPPTMNDFKDWAAALSLDECTVDIRRPPSVILQCIFNSTNDVASKVHVIADSCENNENVSQPADVITSTDAKVSASVDFASMISETEKNSGVPFNKNFCARIDVFANNGTIDIRGRKV